MINKVFLLGRLTRDPELRNTSANVSVASFSLAVDRNVKKTGDPNQQTVDFFDVVAFSHTAEFVSKYIFKGMLLAVCGRLQTRKWVDKENNNRISYEIVAEEVSFGESKRSENAGGYNIQPNYSQQQPSGGPANVQQDNVSPYVAIDDSDEELPF